MNRYEIKARGPRAELRIYGDIGASWWEEESNDAKGIVDKIAALEGDIAVRLNSYGGSVADGLAIFNALKRHQGSVTVHIDGVAYSIASLIAMAGSEIRMASNALMMVHAPWGAAVGNAVEMRDMADVLDKYAEAMLSSYLRDGGPSADTVRGWLTDGEDHYFTAAEALEWGLVDVADDPASVTDIAASLRTSQTPYKIPAAGRKFTPQHRSAEMADEKLGTPESANGDVVATHGRVVDAARKAGAKAEATRRKMIDSVFAGFTTGDDLNEIDAVYQACLDNVDCDELEARRALTTALARTTSNPVVAREHYDMPRSYDAPPRASQHLGGVTMGRTNDEKRYGEYVDAVSAAFGIAKGDVKGSELTGRPLSELARSFARDVGLKGVEYADKDSIVRALMDKNINARMHIGYDVRAMHSTGDFPGLLANVIDKQIRVMYEQVQETWRSVARVGSVPDFKQASRPAMSAFSDLLEVPEGGEYKHGTMSDVVEYLTAKKYGRMISFTREMLVNDDLQAFADATMRIALAASRKVGDDVWNIFTSNPTLNQDSTAVFHADHGNIGTAGAPSVTTLSEARRLMRVQKDPSGEATLGLSPALLIVPPTWETEARVLVSSQELDYELADSAAGIAQKRAANQFGNLQVIVEDRLGGTAGTDNDWFVQANPMGPVPFIEVAFVRGQEAPQIESREGWSVDGIEYKVRMEYGVAALAYQPVVRNAGS